MKSKIKRILGKASIPVLSILIAVIVGSIITLACGYSPLAAYSSLLKGAFGSTKSWMGTLEKCVPLIFCGLAAMVSFKSGMFNIGLEGQAVVGAITYILTGSASAVSSTAPPCIGVRALAMLAGGLWAGIAGAMKVYFGANEVVSTIMLNYIALYLEEYLFSGPFMDEGTIPQSEALHADKMIPGIAGSTKITWAFGHSLRSSHPDCSVL